MFLNENKSLIIEPDLSFVQFFCRRFCTFESILTT
jgi:hypothetical protein